MVSIMNKHKHIHLIILSLLLTVLFPSCHITEHPMQKEQRLAENSGFEAASVSDLKGLDGCRYVLKLETGEVLEPGPLPDEFKKDNLLVWIKYKVREGSSICMAGKMVTIMEIKLR